MVYIDYIFKYYFGHCELNILVKLTLPVSFFSFYFLSFLFYLSNLKTPHGAQSPDPKIKSHTLLHLSQPDTLFFLFLSCFCWYIIHIPYNPRI